MPIRLLVAVDCGLCQYGIQALVLGTPDFRIVGFAPDGELAIQLAGSLHPDLLLLDTELRSAAGLTVMARVRYHDPAIRGVFWTSKQGEQWERLGYEAGASAWVHQSIEPERLLEILRDVHAGRHVPAPAARLEAQPAGRRESPLSPKEIGVLRHAVRGLASREIAALVGCAPRTVDKHLESVRHKFGVTHPRAIIAIGLVYLRELDLRAEELRHQPEPLGGAADLASGPALEPPKPAPETAPEAATGGPQNRPAGPGGPAA